MWVVWRTPFQGGLPAYLAWPAWPVRLRILFKMRAALQSDGERGQGNLQIANCTTVIHRQWVALLGERLKKIFCLTNKAVARQVGQVIPSTKGKTLVPFWSRCRQYVWVSLKKAFIRFIKYIYYISQITIRHFQKCVYPLFPLRFFFGKLIFRQAGREGYPLSRKNPLDGVPIGNRILVLWAPEH